jgi:hypothetical protein
LEISNWLKDIDLDQPELFFVIRWRPAAAKRVVRACFGRIWAHIAD